MRKPANKLKWARWLREVTQLDLRWEVGLAGFPGHIRMPDDWTSRGEFPEEHLVYLVTGGELAASFEGRVRSFPAGTLLWLCPGTAFHFARIPGKELTVVRCRLRSNRRIKSPWPWRSWQTEASCLAWIEWLILEADQHDSWNGLRTTCLVGGLLTDLARIESGAGSPTGGLTLAQRQSLVGLLADRPDARANPRELARATGLSYDYFSRCFRRSYAKTPRRWLLEQRMNIAMMRLMETNMRVGEIARELGYDDLFLFSRQFRAVAGLSPLAYRKSRCAVQPPAAVSLE